MSINPELDEYATRDLGEAATLFCKQAKILRFQKQEDYFLFVFSDKDLCEKVVSNYLFGECLVNAKTFYDALRNLKDRLFTHKEEVQSGR